MLTDNDGGLRPPQLPYEAAVAAHIQWVQVNESAIEARVLNGLLGVRLQPTVDIRDDYGGHGSPSLWHSQQAAPGVDAGNAVHAQVGRRLVAPHRRRGLGAVDAIHLEGIGAVAVQQ